MEETMTHLRKMMIEELVRRNYSERTHECYIKTIEEFSKFYNCPPDRLGLEHIRIFQAHLFTDKKLSPNTVNQRLAALRFFFVKTLHRPWNTAETPYPKRVFSLPRILSPEEVGLLIESADLPFHRVILMTLYATGVRRAELANMRVSDIDSKRMVIRVRGKGLKDRLWATAHKRSYVPEKVMRREITAFWRRH
jgi:integrase/recombinase XerD